MSLPSTTLSLPAISLAFHRPAFGAGPGIAGPLPRVRTHSVDLGLRSPYPSPPMSRRSSIKPTATNQAPEQSLPQVHHVRDSTTAPSTLDTVAGIQHRRTRSSSAASYQYRPAAATTSISQSSGSALAGVAGPTGFSTSISVNSSPTYTTSNSPDFRIFQFQRSSPQGPPSGAPSIRNTRPTRTVKQHVQSACANCKKAHLSCDEWRPCERCVARNLEASCVDVKHKKRGRPRLRDYPELAGSNPEDEQASPSQSRKNELSTSTVPRQGDEKNTNPQPTVLSPLSSVTTPTALYKAPQTPSTKQLPIAFLDMDFNIAHANEPFQRAFSFAGDFPGTTLERLIDPDFVGAIRHLRIVLLEERDALNPSYLPPIRTADAPQFGQIPTIDSQNLETICRGYVPKRETWTFKTAGGTSQSLPVQIRLARTEVIFLTLILLAEERSDQLGSGKLSSIGSAGSTTPRPTQTATEAQLSNLPPLRRSSRLEGRPFPPYPEFSSQLPPLNISGAMFSGSSASSSGPYSAPALSSMNPDSTNPAIGPKVHPRYPHSSPLYEMLQSQQVQRRRSLAGGSTNSSNTQQRRRAPPPSISFHAVPINDPAVQTYAVDSKPQHYQDANQSSQTHSPQHFGTSSQSSRLNTPGQLASRRLPPISGFDSLPANSNPPTTMTTAHTISYSSPQEFNYYPHVVSDETRGESRIEQTRRRASAREQGLKEYELDVKQEDDSRRGQHSSPSENSRKRAANDG